MKNQLKKILEPEEEIDVDPEDEIKRKREELIKLSEDGQFDRDVKAIKKASNKTIERYYNEYERKKMQKANEFLTDQLISKFADALRGLDAIESPDVLSDELRKDNLLKSDVIKIIENISPYIPFLGFLSGGIITVKHVYEHKTKNNTVIVEEPKTSNYAGIRVV